MLKRIALDSVGVACIWNETGTADDVLAYLDTSSVNITGRHGRQRAGAYWP